MTLTVIHPPGKLDLAITFGDDSGPKYFSAKVKAWDPLKHPKGYKGLFIETPDKIDAGSAKTGDVLVTKTGKAFKVEKQTASGVKVNPIDLDTGEVKQSYTVLGNDVLVATVEKGDGVGTKHPVSELKPGTYIRTKSGKRFQVTKHGKWTTVYPVDDAGNVTGKHTVLPPQTVVTVAAPDESQDPTPTVVKKIEKIAKDEGLEWAFEEDPTMPTGTENLEHFWRVHVAEAMANTAILPDIEYAVNELAEKLPQTRDAWVNWANNWCMSSGAIPPSTDELFLAWEAGVTKAKEVLSEQANNLAYIDWSNPNTAGVAAASLASVVMEAMPGGLSEMVDELMGTPGPELSQMTKTIKDLAPETAAGFEDWLIHDLLLEPPAITKVMQEWHEVAYAQGTGPKPLPQELTLPGMTDSQKDNFITIIKEELAELGFQENTLAAIELELKYGSQATTNKQWLSDFVGQYGEFPIDDIWDKAMKAHMESLGVVVSLPDDGVHSIPETPQPTWIDWTDESKSIKLADALLAKLKAADPGLWVYGDDMGEPVDKLALSLYQKLSQEKPNSQSEWDDIMEGFYYDGLSEALAAAHVPSQVKDVWSAAIEEVGWVPPVPMKIWEINTGQPARRAAKILADALYEQVAALEPFTPHSPESYQTLIRLSLKPDKTAWMKYALEQVQQAANGPPPLGAMSELEKVWDEVAALNQKELDAQWDWEAAPSSANEQLAMQLAEVVAVQNVDGGSISAPDLVDDIIGTTFGSPSQWSNYVDSMMSTHLYSVADIKAAKETWYTAVAEVKGSIEATALLKDEAKSEVAGPTSKQALSMYPNAFAVVWADEMGWDVPQVLEQIGDRKFASRDEFMEYVDQQFAEVRDVNDYDTMDWSDQYTMNQSHKKVRERIVKALNDADVEATSLEALQAKSIPQQVQEILPTKLPKVPKPYPSGVGKDTKIVIANSDMDEGKLAIGDWFQVRRLLTDDPDGPHVVLGTASSESAAMKIARANSADHEQIEVREFGVVEDALKEGNYVVRYGIVYQVVDASNPSSVNLVELQGDGSPASTEGMRYSRRGGGLAPISSERVKELIDPGAGSGTLMVVPNEEFKQLLLDRFLENNSLGVREPNIKRKARPERFSVYLTADWSPDQVVGESVNTAIKALGKLGYREIKPRQKSQVRMVRADGQRLYLGRNGNTISSVSAPDPELTNGSAGELHGALAEALAQDLDLDALDPAGITVPLVLRTSYARRMVFDMAMGKRNGVEQSGSPLLEGQLRLEAESRVPPAEEFLDDVPTLEIGYHTQVQNDLLKYAVPGIGMGKTYSVRSNDPEYVGCLRAILSRRVVANAFLPEDALTVDADWYSPTLREQGDLLESGVESAAEALLDAHKQWKIDETGPFTEMAPDTRSRVLSNVEYKQDISRELLLTAGEKLEQQAFNRREAAIDEELRNLRTERGLSPEPSPYEVPNWEQIEFEKQTFDQIDQDIAAIEEGVPTDVPAFYTGGVATDGVLYHRANETHGRVAQELDSYTKNRLQEQGAISGKNTRSIDPGYSGSGQIYDGQQLTLYEDEGHQGLLDERKAHMASPRVKVGDVWRLQDGNKVRVTGSGTDVEPEGNTFEYVDVEEVTSYYDAATGTTLYTPAGLEFRVTSKDAFAIAPEFADKTTTLEWWEVNPEQRLHREPHPDEEMVDAIRGGAIQKALGATESPEWVALLEKRVAEAAPESSSYQLLELLGSEARYAVWEAAQAIINDGTKARRIEYVPHDQPPSNTGGSPTNQRGRLTVVGYTPAEAARRLSELGLLGELEPEIPRMALLRSNRRYGAVAPLHPAYVRGEAEPPRAPARITHGLTGGEDLDKLKRIFNSGGLLSIYERHRQGIKAMTASPAGDIRSGIDHGVFCTLNSGGAVGGSASVRILLKPAAFMRRDVVLAPYDFGAADTRYPSYRNYLNKLQRKVKEPETSLYVPVSPTVRQEHLDKVDTEGSNEFNLAPAVMIEDMEVIQVPPHLVADVKQMLDEMLASGRVASIPRVVGDGPTFKRMADRPLAPSAKGEVDGDS